jgi:poly-gamma-glutamate capsule biosynthesis protein CapA/YwtB (metallophosphatase superfamily)
MNDSRTDYYRGKRKKAHTRLLRYSLGITALLFLLMVLFIYVYHEDFEDQAAQQTPAKEQEAAPSEEEGSTVTNPSDDYNVSFAFVGDILLGGKVADLLSAQGYDYPYTEVKNLLQRPDLTVGNLETPVTENGDPQDKKYVFRSSPQALPSLVEAGFDLVSLANNHVLDYGIQGLLETLDHMNKVNLPIVGAGRNDQEAYQPVYLKRNGQRIAFVGLSRVIPEPSWGASHQQPGVAVTYNPERALQSIEKARGEADLVVVLVHWGIELDDTPEAYQVELAHQYIDSGADLVIGSHPHVLQGLESYKGKWIAYSLGNFIFTTSQHPTTWETVVLEVLCSRGGDCELKLIPVMTKWAKPKPMDAEHGAKLLARVQEISTGVEIRPDGTVTSR